MRTIERKKRSVRHETTTVAYNKVAIGSTGERTACRTTVDIDTPRNSGIKILGTASSGALWSSDRSGIVLRLPRRNRAYREVDCGFRGVCGLIWLGRAQRHLYHDATHGRLGTFARKRVPLSVEIIDNNIRMDRLTKKITITIQGVLSVSSYQ